MGFNIGYTFLGFFLMTVLLMSLLGGNPFIMVMPVFKFSWKMMFMFDWVSLVFFLVLSLIVYSVFLFGATYLKNDLAMDRFFLVLLLFVASMIVLMFTPHFMFFLMGWDGLGLTSLVLISYYKAPSSWAASLKTFLMNRLGDSFMMLSLAFFFSCNEYFFFGMDNVIMGFGMMMLFFGLMTKSAQFPFSSWLPAAMAAPTPVSALVHSSTLVTAGLYLLLRVSHLFNKYMGTLLGLLGLVTLVLGSVSAFFEMDAKKMVAFSTLSNLGMMAVALSFGSVYLSFFHLLTHALSKALLFISVGYFIHFKNHFQDCRLLSSKSFSLMYSMSFFYSILSLLGFMFCSGYFSKDLLLENFSGPLKVMFYTGVVFSVVFTCLYSARLMKLLSSTNNFVFSVKICNTPKKSKMFSVSLLFFFSLFLGYTLMFKIFSVMVMKSWFKFVVYFLMLLGLFYGYVLFLNPSWMMSKIFFLENFKSSFWIFKFSHFGETLYTYIDKGFMTLFIVESDSSMSKINSVISNKSINLSNMKMCFSFVSAVLMLFLFMV